jgi:hypothetical protein
MVWQLSVVHGDSTMTLRQLLIDRMVGLNVSILIEQGAAPITQWGIFLFIYEISIIMSGGCYCHLSLSETKSGYIGSAIRRGLAAAECGRRSGWRTPPAHPCSVIGAFPLQNNFGMTAAGASRGARLL